MELFKLLGRIAIDNSGANKEIDETTDKAEKAHGRISGAFSKIGTAAINVGKVVGAGFAASAGAVAALTKTAIDSYADYEQLVGGVETLFKESEKTVRNYAANAYKTAGLSANEYMETVTSFSASLLQSLDGDTALAAEKANRAITDMSDNANKMGSSMESIQNAYQGFAKQNYTMLDNLKLGYGGTKEEMQRLIQEASKMKDVQAELGVTVDANSMSFGNIVDAISVVQKNMGIMGTTAAEAEKTISGSVSSMKSAWKNLLTGFGNDNANLTRLIHQFANSAMTAADNILPRVEVILNGIAQAIPKFISLINQRLPGMLESLLPPLIEAAAALFTGLVSALPTLLKIILEQAPFILSQIGLALKEAFPQLLLALKELLVQAWDFVSLELLNTGVGFSEAWAVISEKISSAFESVWSVCQWVWSNYGQPIWDMVSLAVTELLGLFQKNMPAIKKFFQDAMAGIKDTWNNHLMPVFQAISDALNNGVKPAFEFVFKTIIEPLITNVFDTIRRLWHGTLKPVFDGIVDFLLGVFTNDWTRAFQGVLNIVTGIFNSIRLAIEKPMDIIKDIVESTINFILEKFDFDWRLPDLKLPHFTISGSFSLNPLTVPSFGIEWYKKAMDNPMIMEQPTAFGINSLGQIMAGGEAGSEVVSGTDTLMNMIASAVAAQNGALVAVLYKILDAIISMDGNMGGNLRDALDGTAFEMNNREFARLVKAVN